MKKMKGKEKVVQVEEVMEVEVEWDHFDQWFEENLVLNVDHSENAHYYDRAVEVLFEDDCD